MVAEKVMGREVIKRPYSDEGPCLRAVDSRQWVPMPFYSTDIAAAWEVVEKMSGGAKDNVVIMRTGDQWGCRFRDIESPEKPEFSQAQTAPMAICISALKSVGVDVPTVQPAQKQGVDRGQ
jgi:hypothetical protein